MLLTRPYFRERAVQYARRWALGRNPLFFDFSENGGDCTSFVSQCILAGCCTQNYTEDFGWYYISEDERAPAWSGVEFFYDFITGGGDFPPRMTRTGPTGMEVSASRAQIGDAVQLYDSEDNFYHTLIISEKKVGEIYVCAHTNDYLDRPLSSYVNASGVRFIHIQAAIVEIEDDSCFEDLISGKALP